MTRDLFCLTLIFFTIINPISTQILNDVFSVGIAGGCARSVITDLEPTFCPNHQAGLGSSESQANYNALVGFFAQYKNNSGLLALHGEIHYGGTGSKFSRSGTTLQSAHEIELRYDYVNLLGMIKIYPFGDLVTEGVASRYPFHSGLHLGVGYQIGLPVTPRRIYFQSDPPDQKDIIYQQNFRDALIGVNTHAMILQIGGEYTVDKEGRNLLFDLRIAFGLKDIMEVHSSGFEALVDETFNRLHTIQFSIGYTLSAYQNR